MRSWLNPLTLMLAYWVFTIARRVYVRRKRNR
jgi:hypothetical protein